MTLADEKKGITVKIDADLHAEVREYIEQHGMTMAEFITLAVDNELHPKYQNKEEKNMGTERHPQVIFSWLCICPSQEGSCRAAPAPPWILQRGTRSRQAEYLSLRRPLDRLTSQTALKE